MTRQQVINIRNDKLTRSIENSITGDTFKTLVVELAPTDKKKLTKANWLFDWKAEAEMHDRITDKLVIVGNETTIQGLVSLQDRNDHIFMPLIESAKFNRGAKKMFMGVPGNLVAFACKYSFNMGYEGFVSFESNTKLVEHYCNSLGAHVLFGNIIAIDTLAAAKLVKQYFPENV